MRRVPIVLLAGLLAAGCAAASTTPPGAGPATVPPPAPTRSSTPPAASGAPAVPPAAGATPPAAPRAATDLILARRADHLAILDGGNLERLFEVPAGVGTPDWLTVYTATPDGAGTRVSRLRVEDGGAAQRQQSIPGRFVPATLGPAGATVGLSGDGRTLVLVDPAPPAGHSRLAILSTALDAPARMVTLAGDFTFDTMTPDGQRLYLVEHLAKEAGGDYVVRSYDMAKRALDPGIVAAKSDSGEAMAGTPIEQVIGTGGWVFTLYIGPDGPFVHALSTIDRVAMCIDLPVSPGADAATPGWALAADAGRTVLYAVNASLGRIYQIDPAAPTVVRAADLATAGTPVMTLAKFDGPPGAAGTNAALSPDGSTLYVVAPTGVLAVSTGDLKARARLLPDRAVAGIGVSADGRAIYALGRDGRILSVDSVTGTPLGVLQGTGYDAILRVVGAHP